MLLPTDVARRRTPENRTDAVDTEREQSDRYIVGGLNISKSKIGWSVSDVVCMRPRDRGAKLHSWSPFAALHVCSHFELRSADSMLECRATCRGHPMPAESISIVGGCIGSRCRENSRASCGDTIRSCPAAATAVPFASLALFIRWSIISVAKVS